MVPEDDQAYQKWEIVRNNLQSDLAEDRRYELFKRIQKLGSEIDDVRGYKNLENLVIHSLEREDSSICISKKLMGKVVLLIMRNPETVSIMDPCRNDPLI